MYYPLLKHLNQELVHMAKRNMIKTFNFNNRFFTKPLMDILNIYKSYNNSMASYQPPSENLPIFNPTVFTTTSNNGLTLEQANALYVHYPYAQGTVNFPDIEVSNNALIDNNITINTKVIQKKERKNEFFKLSFMCENVPFGIVATFLLCTLAVALFT